MAQGSGREAGLPAPSVKDAGPECQHFWVLASPRPGKDTHEVNNMQKMHNVRSKQQVVPATPCLATPSPGPPGPAVPCPTLPRQARPSLARPCPAAPDLA